MTLTSTWRMGACAAVALLSAAACDSSSDLADPDVTFPPVRVDGVLSPDQLPDRPATGRNVEVAEGAMSACVAPVNGGAYLGDFAYRQQIIAYRDVGGDDVTSGAYEMGDDHAQSTFHQIVSTYPQCAATEKANSEPVEKLVGLPDNEFVYRVQDTPFHDEVVQAFGIRNRTLVQVVVYHDGPGSVAVSAVDLLTKALESVPSD